jgi:hypothetical protein
MRIKLNRPKHATIVAYLALFFAMSGGAYAATGGTLILGHTNTANKLTTLSNTASGAALRLVTHSGATPPLAVSNSTKVVNLNADMVDGLHASSLQLRLPSRLSFTPLTLINGWTGNCFGGGAPGIALAPSGVVHLQGEMCSSTSSSQPFVIPAPLRPSHTEWLTVDECNATTGRLIIGSNGTVTVQGDENPRSSGNTPQCFTSLAGVSYTLPY